MTKISLEELEQLFERMQPELDAHGPLLWGYFFTDPNKNKLRPVRDELDRLGYREAGLYRTDDGKTYVLHVEKVEAHTPHTLHDTNSRFYALAERHGIESYDGMDAGPDVESDE
jgi:hypothetical protein